MPNKTRSGNPVPTAVSMPGLTKLAYQALQQGKSLLGLAHKEASTKLMELVSPSGLPPTLPTPPGLLAKAYPILRVFVLYFIFSHWTNQKFP